MPAANDRLMTRIRSVLTQIDRLEQDLQNFGDRDAADAFKRARREVELVVRQGVFLARGQDI